VKIQRKMVNFSDNRSIATSYTTVANGVAVVRS